MDSDGYAVRVRVGAPTVPPPRLPPILIPGSLIPVQLAEPWRRTVAGLIDAVPFLLAAFGLAIALQGPHIAHALLSAAVTKNGDTKSLGLPNVSASQPLASDQLWQLLRFTAAMVLVYVAWTAYRIVLLARWGRTVGKALLGLAVVDAADPRRKPTVLQAVRRCLVPQGVGLVPIPFTGTISYLWILKDAKRQGLHDRAARTLVVKRPR
jgi:uncharacterized RDD family membrane protein YckC